MTFYEHKTSLIIKTRTIEPYYLHQLMIETVKSSAISTGQLRTSLPLHLRPIDVVVFHGPSSLSGTESSSWGRLLA